VTQQNPPWQHHFVPRSLLSYFTAAPGDKYLYSFDKRTGRSFRASLMSTGSENGYNVHEGTSEPVNFETDFDDADRFLSSSLGEIHASGMAALRNPQRRAAWRDLVTTQLVRAPIVRSTMRATGESLAASIAEMFGTSISFPVPSDNDARLAARALFHDRACLRESLENKDIVLFVPTGQARFRISDRPVTVSNPHPAGDKGLSSPGANVFMPLGPRLVLGLLCPGVRRLLEERPPETQDIPTDVQGRLVALRDALINAVPVACSDEEVRRHNVVQIVESSRFIYGPTGEFDDVMQIIQENPQVGEVRSSIQSSGFGQGPGPNPRMQMGSWLVLTRETEIFTLEVTDVDLDETMRFTPVDPPNLARALAGGPLQEAKFYRDQQQLRMMRDVELRLLPGTPAQFEVIHSDPALRALMYRTGKSRRTATRNPEGD
jgi:hypothetical protein